ncbi:hypothetical protein C8N40_110117 [Pontibacter mucosus]|uniref:Uncharacterized protein n=1 Tax=Pontibacter mucosus TaxID=1649266 RepID=A0A2T5YDU4_9BACT|nr:hypothetical protein C8N40_110117 [Pontibacter mucosus]
MLHNKVHNILPSITKSLINIDKAFFVSVQSLFICLTTDSYFKKVAVCGCWLKQNLTLSQVNKFSELQNQFRGCLWNV